LRALRLERLAEGHPLAEYLRLIAGLCHAQQRLMDDPPDAAADPQRVQRCLEHGLPPFAADSLVREDAWLPWLHGLLQGYQPAAQSARWSRPTTLRNASAGQLKIWALAGQRSVLLLPAAPCRFSARHCRPRGVIGC
jgi:FdhE protein